MKTNPRKIRWMGLLLLTAVLLAVPAGEGFSGTVKAYTVITAAGIGMFALQLFDSPLIPSLFLLFGYCSLCDMETVMNGWAKEAPWCILCILILIEVMKETPLLRRIAYRTILLTGGSYGGICCGLYLVGFIFSALGDTMSAAMMAIGFGIVHSLRLDNTPAGAGILHCSLLGVGETGLFILNPSSIPLLYSIASSASHKVPANIDHVRWFQNGAVFIPYYLLLLLVVIRLFRPKEGVFQNGREYFRQQLEALGPMTLPEKKLGIILLGMLAFLLTGKLHGLGLVYGSVGAVVLLFLPGIGVGSGEELKRVNFAFPVFFVACISIGNVAGRLGIGGQLVEFLLPYLNQSDITVYLFTIAGLCFLLNFVMTPMAVYSALLFPLTAITMELTAVHDLYPLLAAMYSGLC